MKIMKRFILLITVIVGTLNLCGQERQGISLLNERLSFNMLDYWAFMNQEHFSLVSYGLLYNIVDFPNASANNLIKQEKSFSFNFRTTFFPFILDMGMFSSKFKVNNIYSMPLYEPDQYSLHQRFGYDISLSVSPLPYIGRISEIIVPYAGFGYQWSDIGVEKSKDGIPYSSVNLSACLWKAGCNIYFGDLPFNLIVEYKRTINNDKKRNFSFLSFGASFELLSVNTFKNKAKGSRIYMY